MNTRLASGVPASTVYPDAKGRFGKFGGRYVPETLVPALDRLQAGVNRYLGSEEFLAEFHHELRTWVGRPTALSFAPTLSKRWGAEVWLKREDLAHTGAHKINNAVGQTLLAKRLGAKRIIAETGAGQHGVASAAAAARLGLPCVVYMGAVDVERQAPNVGRMQLMGATVVPVTSGDKTLRAAIDEALRDWVSDPDGTYYSLGSAVGPHPYPYLVRELQAVIGREARAQNARIRGKPARSGDRLRRRRLECDRPVSCVSRRCAGTPHRRRSGRPRPRARRQRRFLDVRHAGGPARQLFAAAPGCVWPDSRDSFRVGGSRLSGRRARTRVLDANRPRHL